MNGYPPRRWSRWPLWSLHINVFQCIQFPVLLMITWFMFPLFRHADEGDARLIQWFVWGCVQSVKLRSNSFQSFFKYYCRVIIFFCNLVHKNDLLDQYPEATSLIKELPASLDDKCFKPQAHMLIEKVFSLKKKPLVIFLLKIWWIRVLNLQ